MAGKSLDIIVMGKPMHDGPAEEKAEKEDTGPDEGLVSAMEEFESAKTPQAKADALKAFVHMCMDKYGGGEEE